MRTLLSERFAPVTSSIGFLEAPADRVAEELGAWRRSLHGRVVEATLNARFPQALLSLEPLTSGVRQRELVTTVGETWTAYFDNSLLGTDAVSTVGHLALKLRCQGVAIRTVPHTVGISGVDRGRAGAVQFELFGPIETDFLNYVRTVSCAFDGSRWRFDATGTEQRFEEVEGYSARRVRDRFDSEMLDRYCGALGIPVFDAAQYGPRCQLVENSIEVPPDGKSMSLIDAQRWLEITPGRADQLPG